jgi:radical SAM/Cys-rich protein
MLNPNGPIAMHDTRPLLDKIAFPPITRVGLETLQVNVGYRCNQACFHCHVNAGPTRTEAMADETVDLVLEVLKRRPIGTLDITGGAPELHPRFRNLALAARQLSLKVIDRCNLTVLGEPGQEDLATFLAENRICIIASLPCYLEANVDAQRGEGVFARSLAGLRALNGVGYGDPETALTLDLVFNPQGPRLPPSQEALEGDYKRILWERHGIVFNRLFTLANMPINRFGARLVKRQEFDGYMELLAGAHRDANLDGVMCRSLISVDWRGCLYDCDFNQMLDLPLGASKGRAHLRDLLEMKLAGQAIRVAGHCFGCTAGQGSSCGGALAAVA